MNIKRIKNTDEKNRIRVHEDGEVAWLSFPMLDQFDFLTAGFSTRMGGVSAGDVGSMNLSFSREMTMCPDDSEEACRARVRENHERLAAAAGYDVNSLVLSDQTHQDYVRRVGRENIGEGFTKEMMMSDVDGLMTDEPGVVLMTFYADCVPLLIADPVHRAVASVHSGWKGTVSQIGLKAVKRMQECYGSKPEELYAAIAPSICQDCYEVSGDVIGQVKAAYPENIWPELFRDGRKSEDGQHYQLNLQRCCLENFLMAGMKQAHISLPDLCTCCNSDFLFSHRASHGRRGCLGAFIVIRES